MPAFLRSALAAVLALFVLSGPEASAFKLTPKTGVAAGAAAGVGWSLKKNIGKMTDRLSSMLGDSVNGRGDKLGEHEAWFEKTGGRLALDAHPLLSLPKRALDAGEEMPAAVKRGVERLSKWAGDKLAALAVGKKDREFLESGTGILGPNPLPEPRAMSVAARSKDTDPWGVGRESAFSAAATQQPAEDCWMATGGRACPARATSPWDKEYKPAKNGPWGGGADRANAETHPNTGQEDGNAQSDYEAALNRTLGKSVGGIVEDIDYDSMLAALEEKEAAQKRAEEAERERQERLAARRQAKEAERRRQARLADKRRLERERQEQAALEQRWRQEARQREYRQQVIQSFHQSLNNLNDQIARQHGWGGSRSSTNEPGRIEDGEWCDAACERSRRR